MNRRHLFQSAVVGALGVVASRLPVGAAPAETSDWVRVLPDDEVEERISPTAGDTFSFGYLGPGDDRYAFDRVSGYGWKETTGTGILAPESGAYWDHDTCRRRVALARAIRKNYVELGVVTGPDESGNWFVPDFSIMVGGTLQGPDEFGNWFVPAQHSYRDEERVLVRDHGVLAGSSEPFLFRWDWVVGAWVLNREYWTEDQV